jgi:hypothetical protein
MQWYEPDAKSLYTVELDRPYWDEVTLQIAEAVRTHEPVARLAVPSYLSGHFHRPSDVTDWLADLRERFPVVALELADASLAADGRADTEQRARRYQRRAKSLLRTISPQRLYPALEAYRRWVETKYVELDGRQSQWAGAKLRQIGFVLASTPDMSLSDFYTPQIDTLLDTIRRRPPSKRTGRPIAVKTANNLVYEVRQFVRWLHRSPEWDWTKPLDYEVMLVRVVTTPAERAGRVHQVKTYTVGELRLLWRYPEGLQLPVRPSRQDRPADGVRAGRHLHPGVRGRGVPACGRGQADRPAGVARVVEPGPAPQEPAGLPRAEVPLGTLTRLP